MHMSAMFVSVWNGVTQLLAWCRFGLGTKCWFGNVQSMPRPAHVAVKTFPGAVLMVTMCSVA